MPCVLIDAPTPSRRLAETRCSPPICRQRLLPPPSPQSVRAVRSCFSLLRDPTHTARAHTHRSPPGKTTLNTHIYKLMWVKIVLIIVHASFERNQNIHQQKRGGKGESVWRNLRVIRRIEMRLCSPVAPVEGFFFCFLLFFLRRFRNKPVYYD